MTHQPINDASNETGIPARHPKYFDVVFLKIENTSFTVPKHLLLRSEVFSDMFQMPQEGCHEGLSEDKPVILEGVSACDFESLLTVLYTPYCSAQQSELDTHLVPAYCLAHKWGFRDLEKYLLPVIENKFSDVEKILFARRFDLKDWLVSGHMQLCYRTNPITSKEAAELGVQSVLLILRLKEDAMRLGSACSSCRGLNGSSLHFNCLLCGKIKPMVTVSPPTESFKAQVVRPKVEQWVQNGCMAFD